MGLVFLLLFIVINQHGRGQLFDLTIFLRPTVACAGFAYFALQFINIGISVVITVYAQEGLGISTVISGLILLPGSLVGGAVAPLAGYWADRTHFRYPVLTGAALLFIATIGFWFGQRSLNTIAQYLDFAWLVYAFAGRF